MKEKSLARIKGRRLVAGDKVALIAPAGPFLRRGFNEGVRLLHSWGLETTWREDIFTVDDYLAGDDQRRLDEVHGAFCDEETRAIFCVRGGYGALRLLDRIDGEIIRKHPKLLVGFSDNTALLFDLWRRVGLCALQAPMPAQKQFHQMSAQVEKWYRRLLFDPAPPGDLPCFSPRSLRGGKVRGRLLPGNLSLVIHLLAAKRLPDLDGAILVLEDTNEAPYRIDRMLTTLRLSGVLERVGGLVFGQMPGLDEEDLEELVGELVRGLDIPVLIGAPVGHGSINVPIPVGVSALLDGDSIRLEVLEAPVC